MQKIFLEQFSRIGKALSNPSRLELLDLLSQSEKSVETLVAHSGMSLKNVSAQLKALKEAGLIRSRKEGKYIFYSVSHSDVTDFWLLLQKFGSQHIKELQQIANELLHSKGSRMAMGRGELLKKAKAQDLILIDVRPSDEYGAGHLPHAISIPITDLGKKLKMLPKDKDIVVYCRGPFCLFAQDAVELLRKKGYTAFRLEQSVHEWKRTAE